MERYKVTILLSSKDLINNIKKDAAISYNHLFKFN